METYPLGNSGVKNIFICGISHWLKTLIKMHLVSGVLHHFSEILKIFNIAPSEKYYLSKQEKGANFAYR